MGLTNTINEAQQLIAHGFVFVNDKKIKVKNFFLKPGDFIQVKQFFQSNKKNLLKLKIKRFLIKKIKLIKQLYSEFDLFKQLLSNFNTNKKIFNSKYYLTQNIKNIYFEVIKCFEKLKLLLTILNKLSKLPANLQTQTKILNIKKKY